MKNGRPASHTDRARELATELEGIDWDEDSSVTIVDGGGRKVRVRTPSHAEIHLDEATPTKPDNQPVSSVAAPAKGAAHVLKHVTSWQHVAALAILAALMAFLVWKGVGLW